MTGGGEVIGEGGRGWGGAVWGATGPPEAEDLASASESPSPPTPVRISDADADEDATDITGVAATAVESAIPSGSSSSPKILSDEAIAFWRMLYFSERSRIG